MTKFEEQLFADLMLEYGPMLQSMQRPAGHPAVATISVSAQVRVQAGVWPETCLPRPRSAATATRDARAVRRLDGLAGWGVFMMAALVGLAGPI